jgi:release factor glutamine methyltransferase
MTTVAGWLADHADLDRLDTDLLLAEVLGCNRAQLISHPERLINQNELAQLKRWTDRRRGGEPLAYILQRKEFWSLELAVNPTVLIPRPDTELLVEQTLSLVVQNQEQTTNLRVLDLGTGSGAIAIALATELDHAVISASDVSQAALKVAASNAATHNTAIKWVASDWFMNISDTFHMIVTNPPYVAETDPHLAALKAEPREALVSGVEGLDAIRYIVPTACKHLVTQGWLLIEHGHDQGPAVRGLMNRTGYENVKTTVDLAGVDRVTQGQWRSAQ